MFILICHQPATRNLILKAYFFVLASRKALETGEIPILKPSTLNPKTLP